MKPNKLKARLVERGYSQRKLAKKIGANPGTLGAKINGNIKFYFAEVVAICRVLEITDPQEVLDIFGE